MSNGEGTLKPIKEKHCSACYSLRLRWAVADAAAESAGSNPPIDQVVVEGTRADLVKAAKDILAAEQRFYERYNKLNNSRKYAVRCTEEADTGSRFKKKRCTPQYENDATASEGR